LEGIVLKVLVIGAMEVEILELVEKIEASNSGSIFGNAYFTKSFDTVDVMIVECGIGKVNAAILTQKAIDLFNPDILINTGIAGSIDCNIGDIVLGKELTYHDVRPGMMLEYFPYTQNFLGDIYLIKEIKKICEETKKANVIVGKIVSGDRYICSTSQKQRIKEQYQAICVDMESAAIAHTAFLNNVPFVCIRSISDNADENSVKDYERFEKESADLSSAVVYTFIESKIKKKSL